MKSKYLATVFAETKRVTKTKFKSALYYEQLLKGPSLYYVSKRTGWVGSQNGRFCRIYADIVLGGSENSKKLLTYCGMVPKDVPFSQDFFFVRLDLDRYQNKKNFQLLLP